uniref:Uncharacterized protein n=1 Tax=Alexandrium catenella TaxID=2925 RepID=A0A7S1WL55_ALECA|mmetsp:Transcript_70474/g.187334  ORF Transcript_70474/g.187334 Transcript_70474/m.187334 type:complete len:193 (+) Transcript_70474:37-615(+)
MLAGCCCAAEGQEAEVIQLAPSTNESYASLEVPRESGTTRKSGTTEKARLEALVSNFAKRAVKGVPCTLVQEGNGSCTRTQYRITKGLEDLLIMSPDQDGQAMVTCPLKSIQDVYTWLEDGQRAFEGDYVRKADAAGLDKELLIMVVYGPRGVGPSRICLLLGDRQGRDTFLECLRILCVYALHHQKPAATR